MKKFAFVSFLFGIIFCFIDCKNTEADPKIGAPKPDAVLLKLDSQTRVEPMNWWIGFKNPTVQILVRHENIADYNVKIGKYEGVRLVDFKRGDSPNYLFIEISIYATAKPGKIPLIFEKEDQPQFVFEYPILAREGGQKGGGVDSKDVIYLLMPDRFANGDPSNDNLPGMLQPKIYRDSAHSRHGGDLAGIEKNIPYFKDLGVTTLWLNPELENNQPSYSYHGYATTDYFKIDARFGTNENYRDLVKKLHQNDLKIIRDFIPNHCGSKHWWMTDLPTKDWVHQFDTFTRTTYRAPTIVDPNASERDKKAFSDGWFDRTMPDLNQKNPFLAKYLIQNIIWWIEFAGIDGLRIDTYTYNDQKFMSEFCASVRREFPEIAIFGEVWEYSTAMQSYFADNQTVGRNGFDSNCPGMTDFQMYFAVNEMLTREPGWTEGVGRMYYTLVQDFLYENPMKNMIFLDNHDVSRFATTIGGNFDKFRSGMVWLATMRGVPQIYYGSEMAFEGDKKKGDGNLRPEMPGGWVSDRRSVFVDSTRTPSEKQAFDFTKKILAVRKANPVLATGKIMQFVPENGVYTYFRYDENAAVMIILNTSNSEKKVDLRRFAERIVGYQSAKNALTDEILTDLTVSVSVAKNSPVVFILGK